ncbi:MAG: hypothetical protein UV95_C0002G0063 [Candidatus Falkowbacteria bacterium GW2011_GWF2_43_32]|nr:MAG: hypothetical protein UV95_C0002G0063 [Candidatus Falkowbacteria bacterium GW2011_GWF2_43_32]
MEKFLVLAEFGWTGYLYAVVIRHNNLFDYTVFGNLLVLLFPFIGPFIRYFLYYEVGEGNLIFNYFFIKIVLPLKSLYSCLMNSVQRNSI